jgi:acyl carrier protein
VAEVDTGKSKFDLNVALSLVSQRVKGCFQYSAELFTEQTIARMVAHYEEVLTAIAADAEQRIADLPLSEPIPGQTNNEDPQSAQLQSEESFIAPRNSTEEAIAQIWKEVLELPQISVREKFFDIGGDSLKIVRVSLMLEDLYPNAVTVVDLFTYNTIESLSEYLDGQLATPVMAAEGFEL